MKKILCMLLVNTLLLSMAGPAFAEENYTEEDVHVYRDSLDSDETAVIRMNGDIPYMKINDYYNGLIFTGAEKYPDKAAPMKVTRNGSVYETTAYDGTKGIFDTDADTFECENLDIYSTTPYYSLLLNSERDPSASFVRISHTDYSGDLMPVEVDFKTYGIDLIGDGDDLWLPLPTLECLFCNPYAYNVYYNGKGIYIEDGCEQLQMANAKTSDPDYYAFIQAERSDEKVKFDYANLCFYVDTCYGYPESSRLSDSIAEKGLDKTLDETIDGMNLPAVKESLHSSDMKEYAFGLAALIRALDDGGHTRFNDFGMLSEEDSMQWKEKMSGLGIVPRKESVYVDASPKAIMSAYLETRDEFDTIETIKYDNGEMSLYIEKGDTAMYVFEHFYCNRLIWAEYEDGSSKDIPEDTLGTIMKYLEKAKSNPEIKKFVFNLSLNRGGESDVATAISKLINGQAYRHQHDAYTGQDEVIYYDVDLNLDGVFDEKDDEISYPFQFAVISGAMTYSAANYLTNMAKDNGIVVLGEQSGGGACCPQVTPESEGLSFNLSGRYKLMDKNNEHVDFGIEPDYVLTKEDNGEMDYSPYTDFDEISKLIDEYYG